ncbi:hypothetical protein LAh9_36 [Aeromonas phage LAh_9]|uniref:Uncharacterized protein n=1 Tax=Aeromonas phage LAh_9 TaxID=2591033 RepID=A0A514A122_9CAUD|nr:hypothetical protein HWC32_gp036 [Aeromonas phage LAh_9]QDH46978.1 hypothetical protein LAh9_36 [Aeromonas phage LAh_9]
MILSKIKEVENYSKRIQSLENQCFHCGFTWTILTAFWVYNKHLKRRLPVCPNCESGVIIHIPSK